MEAGAGLFSRHAERMTAEALTDTRVVVVNGARQVGKSTLAELIAARSVGARELYLDDQAVRAAAEADPSAFVRHDGLLMIDEIQRVPELLLAIKREVDRDSGLGGRLIGMSEERAKAPRAAAICGHCWRTSRSARSRASSPGQKSLCSSSTIATAIR